MMMRMRGRGGGPCNIGFDLGGKAGGWNMMTRNLGYEIGCRRERSAALQGEEFC